jgi:transcriptional regulator with XRE-family HTH domain
MRTHDEFMKGLPAAQRKKIEARAKELIAEEMTLRDLRKARKQSQETVAELLGIRQGDVSKLERRTDVYLSTLRRYVESMGGQLELVATFPDRPPVKIVHLGDLKDETDNVIRKEGRRRA